MCKINGKKLVELRTEAGVSQAQLARETGISPSSINKYEKGTLNPSDEVVSKICNVFTLRTFKVIKNLYACYGKDYAEEKLLNRCSGSTFFENRVAPVKSNTELFDILATEICK